MFSALALNLRELADFSRTFGHTWSQTHWEFSPSYLLFVYAYRSLFPRHVITFWFTKCLSWAHMFALSAWLHYGGAFFFSPFLRVICWALKGPVMIFSVCGVICGICAAFTEKQKSRAYRARHIYRLGSSSQRFHHARYAKVSSRGRS